jgi:hypothetical protein
MPRVKRGYTIEEHVDDEIQRYADKLRIPKSRLVSELLKQALPGLEEMSVFEVRQLYGRL